LNWQHAHKTTWFAGYSYERWYQAIRRLLRFGQLHDVECHLIRTVNEGSIMESIARKQKENSELHREMALRMRDGMLDELGLKNNPQKYVATQTIEIPKWLKTRKQPCTH
jgi:hypothetical protein